MKEFRHFLNESINGIFVNGQLVDVKGRDKVKGKQVLFVLSSEKRVTVYPDDEPHFWGDGALNFDFQTATDHAVINISISENTIKKVRVWRWKPNGINIFNSGSICWVTLFGDSTTICSFGMLCEVEGSQELWPCSEIYISTEEVAAERADGPLDFLDVVV